MLPHGKLFNMLYNCYHGGCTEQPGNGPPQICPAFHFCITSNYVDVNDNALNFEAGNGLFQANEHMKFVTHEDQMHVVDDDWMHTKSCLRVAGGTAEEARAIVQKTAKVAAEALALLNQQTKYLCTMGHYLFDEDQDDDDNDDDDDDDEEEEDDHQAEDEGKDDEDDDDDERWW
jgi:hypothetical protein